MSLFHLHRWALRDVQHMEYVRGRGNVTVATGDVTVALYRCEKCGRVRTQDIPGVWTIRQLAAAKETPR